MKVLGPWSSAPTTVYEISWSSYGHEAIFHKGSTNLSILDEEGALASIYEHEVEIVDPHLEDFIVMPKEFDGGRVVALMWRPLAESGIWVDLRERYPEAIAEFKELREKFNY